MTGNREALRERVARLYIDKWGLSDYWLADAAIDIVMEEAAKVAEGYHPGSIIGREIAAALRAYIQREPSHE